MNVTISFSELHGRMISVEKAKSESESSSRRQPSARSERRSSKERKEEPPKENEVYIPLTKTIFYSQINLRALWVISIQTSKPIATSC